MSYKDIPFNNGIKRIWTNQTMVQTLIKDQTGKLVLHSFNDEPSFINKSAKIWHYFNKVHRNNKPAIIFANGIQEFWENDKKVK